MVQHPLRLAFIYLFAAAVDLSRPVLAATVTRHMQAAWLVPSDSSESESGELAEAPPQEPAPAGTALTWADIKSDSIFSSTSSSSSDSQDGAESTATSLAVAFATATSQAPLAPALGSAARDKTKAPESLPERSEKRRRVDTGGLASTKRPQKPAALAGTEWWAEPLFNSIAFYIAKMPGPHPPQHLRVDSFCAGMASEAFGAKAPPLLALHRTHTCQDCGPIPVFTCAIDLIGGQRHAANQFAVGDESPTIWHPTLSLGLTLSLES
jgi:hypothetical protein